jgi:hypothetical protein
MKIIIFFILSIHLIFRFVANDFYNFIIFLFPDNEKKNNEYFFSLFSSPELKAQVSYSDRRLSVVRLSVCLSVNFYIFDFFSRTTGPISTKLGTNYPWGEGFQVCSNEGDRLSPRGDNSERVKMH